MLWIVLAFVIGVIVGITGTIIACMIHAWFIREDLGISSAMQEMEWKHHYHLD